MSKTSEDIKIERLQRSFSEISVSIITADRNEANRHFNISDRTLARYIAGDFPEYEAAKEIFDFLRKRIIERANKVSKLVA